MGQEYLFEIGYKAGIPDPVGTGLKNDITELGLARLKGVASAQLYKVSGSLSLADKEKIGSDLLCDPILNESRDGQLATKDKSMIIDVWFKAGVTDVVGESVRKGIEDLDIRGVEEVRTGMRYHLQGVTRREIAEKIAFALFVNPLVHETIISATTSKADSPSRSGEHAD